MAHLRERPPIHYHQTELFKQWMKDRGYTWPSRPHLQEDMIAEEMREGLEKATERRRQKDEN